MRKVWVLGSSNIDITYHVAVIPSGGSTVEATACISGTGGKGANQAFAVSYWGAEVGFIGAVGDDGYANVLLDSLQKGGVNAEYVRRIKGKPSGTAIIFVNPDGENCIVVHPGANKAIPLDLLENIEFKQDDILLAQLEVNLDAVSRAFKRAREKQATTILNPSPYTELSPNILQNTEIVVTNTQEAEATSGMEIVDENSARKAASAIHGKGPTRIVLTLGPQGAMLYNGRDCFSVPGLPVKPVDTQGAGDAFLGSFVAKLSSGQDEAQALAFANKVAAYSVTQHGSTQVSMPDRTDPFLKQEIDIHRL